MFEIPLKGPMFHQEWETSSKLFSHRVKWKKNLLRPRGSGLQSQWLTFEVSYGFSILPCRTQIRLLNYLSVETDSAA